MPDLWDMVVGVPIEDWIRADTIEQLAWLLYLRDHPLQAPPSDACSGDVDVRDFTGRIVRTLCTC